jgi:hypothetical protein
VSIEALSWAWKQDVPTPSTKLVLLALADHTNPDGYCWPSMIRIAGMSGISQRQVSTNITKLVDLGLVVKADRRRAGGQYRGWTYYLPTSGSGVPVASGSEVPVTSGSQLPVGTVRENRKKISRERDYLFEAIVDVCGHDARSLTKSERGRINKAMADLRGASATPDQVRAAANAWTRRFPQARLTATALAGHWSTLLTDATPASRRGDVCPTCGQQIDKHDDDVCAAFDNRAQL